MEILLFIWKRNNWGPVENLNIKENPRLSVGPGGGGWVGNVSVGNLNYNWNQGPIIAPLPWCLPPGPQLYQILILRFDKASSTLLNVSPTRTSGPSPFLFQRWGARHRAESNRPSWPMWLPWKQHLHLQDADISTQLSLWALGDPLWGVLLFWGKLKSDKPVLLPRFPICWRSHNLVKFS